MKHRMIAICTLVFTVLAFNTLRAQDTPDYPLDFPVPEFTAAQIKAARDCDLSAKPPTNAAKLDACQLAQQALAAAKLRGDDNRTPTDDELALVKKIATDNPALLLRLDLLAQYYDALPLTAPPDFSSHPITKLTLKYTFGGMGSSNDYDITITDADKKPVVSGKVQIDNQMMTGTDTPNVTPTPIPLAKTVDAKLVQAFGTALTDFVPIHSQFSSTPCWDYYPDWTIELTFADKTTVSLVTKGSNVVGVGGPWQTEIDGQYYMQYSSATQRVVADLFDALKLSFGETMAMGCGGMNEPLDDAYPNPIAEATASS